MHMVLPYACILLVTCATTLADGSTTSMIWSLITGSCGFLGFLGLLSLMLRIAQRSTAGQP